ncbi:MAG: DNA polymerase IV [Glaciecola sp. HTCC2999]|nr:MAG: DNA polymerase IV [Glaciecola sp. HTCC2999]
MNSVDGFFMGAKFQRKIIHVDMDCFYAAVEMRDNPALRNIPIAIGGSSDRRGVISTCNYPARRFGVRSAMSTAHALRLCPDLVLLPGRMSEYKAVSDHIREIFSRYTTLIEPLSWDEAYLDVTDSPYFDGSATRIAQDIRRVIEAETGLTASAGVAPIKFVAKVASDENKPNGLCVITPERLDDFVLNMSLNKIPGVGKVTVEKLNHLGLFTCNDVRSFPFARLSKQFGKFGALLWNRCHGIDEREVQVHRVRKSVGVERTLPDDIYAREDVENIIEDLLPKLKARIEMANVGKRIKSQGVKLKFNDFQQTTISHIRQQYDEAYFQELLSEILLRRKERGIRLVGLHIGLYDPEDIEQLLLPLTDPNVS